MKNLFLIPLCALFLYSCATSKKSGEEFYHEITPELGYHLYSTSECKGETVAFIPANIPVYTRYPGRKKKVFVSYGSVYGYARTLRYKKAKNTGYRVLPRPMIAYQDSLLSIYNNHKNYSGYNPPLRAVPASSGGTIHVKGYYRKNGTYVRPHTRKAPSRKY